MFIIVKKSYYRLARKFHPDRAAKIEDSNAKFDIIFKAYTILSNSETKRLYDQGSSEILFVQPTVAARWERNIRIVTSDIIEQARNSYINSTAEEEDIIKEFKRGNGSLTFMLHNLPFMRIEDENRITTIIKHLMVIGKIPNTVKIKKIPNRKN